MNNKQILKKAITKAIKNGWEHDLLILDDGVNGYVNDVLCGDDRKLNDGYMSIIYSHSFVKALWGGKKEVDIIVCSNHKCKDRDVYFHKVSNWGSLTEAKKHMKDFPYCSSCSKKMCIEKMEENIENPLYHLQTMVLEKEPLKYIEKFL